MGDEYYDNGDLIIEECGTDEDELYIDEIKPISEEEVE